MKRGMISLSLAAVRRLMKSSIGTNPDLGNLPVELANRISFSTQEPMQSFEISEETAQQLLDLLPTPNEITTMNDPVLMEISNSFRNFVLEMRSE